MSEYDEMTPLERAQIDVERNVYDLNATLAQLSKWRFDPLYAPFYEGNAETLFSSLTSIQLICSTLQPAPSTNVVPLFLKGVSRG